MNPTCAVSSSGDGVTVCVCIPPVLTAGTWVLNITRVALGGYNFTLGDLGSAIHVLFPHAHSAHCNHTPALKGDVYAAAERGDAPGVQTALESRGSTEEADSVSAHDSARE